MVPVTVQEEIDQNRYRRVSHRVFNKELEVYCVNSGVTMKVPFGPLISKYKDFFDKHTVTMDLDEEDFVRYRYAPKRVSEDFYETTAYWSMILFINECHSIIEFEPTTLKLIDPNYIDDLIEEILILEGS